MVHCVQKADVIPAPLRTQHSDYINPFEFVALMRQADGMRPFDVMLKAKDLALLHLRDALQHLASDLVVA